MARAAVWVASASLLAGQGRGLHDRALVFDGHVHAVDRVFYHGGDIGQRKPDVMILDLSMPRISGLNALRALEELRESLRTIVLAGEVSNADLVTAVQLGVRGLVLKDSTTELLFQAIVTVVAGQHFVAPALVTNLLDVVRTFAPQSNEASRGKAASGLTPREREVLGLVVAGYANKEIARTFSVSEETIKHHLTRMFAKVGAANRVELAMVATERGLVADA